MISIIYCTKEHNQKHIDHLKKTAGHPKVEVIEYVNKGEGLTKYYNKGLEESKFDIVVFCHDDIILETKQWAKKLTKLFHNNEEYGILGVAGTKSLPESGRWWEDMSRMYGRVAHTSNGKTWLSSYSEDLGLNIEEVVTVDGVFFSVMKSRIKETFSKEVEGFHFYDIDFCFKNYIKSVKIGVTTKIRVNHMSIGETNNEWEENRIMFSEKYKDNLPAKINKIFGPNHKFKVLLGCIYFNGYTGSELYVYELAKELVKQNCDVTVCSNIGGDLAKRAVKEGIKLADINEPPGYKRGDGLWEIRNQDGGFEPSVVNSLYKISQVDFDIMHLNHTPVINLLLKLYPDIPVITTVHSEVISLEHPVIHDNIKKYIAIRPEIKDYIISEHNIPEDKIDIIYNPIDGERYQKINEVKNSKKRVLFVGTLDYLRKETILDLAKMTKDEGSELWIVGKQNGININEIIADNPQISYYEPTWNVETYMNLCDETAGILLGRTTIEGWLCGKNGWIYDVNDKGEIQSKMLHRPPHDIDKFRSDGVASQIIEEYKEILK